MADEPKTGSDSAVVELNARLRADNAKLRDQKRRLQAEKAELEEKLEKGGVPDGAVVLKPEEAKEYEAFKALKLEPAKITEALTERDQLKAKVADAERDALLREAADSVGYNPKVLADQVRLRELHVEMRDVTKDEDGKKVTVKVPHVRPAKDEKAQLEPLDTYAERELKEYLPALTAEAEEGGTTRRTAATGPSYPPQRKTGTAVKAPPSKQELASRKQAEIDYSL